VTASGRSLAAFGALEPAEQVLLDGLSDGRFDLVEGGDLPAPEDPRRIIRADLLRLLILGAPDAPPVHEKGVRVSGAIIRGVLDLEGCRIPRDIGLVDCRFENALVLRSAMIDTLFLDGSHLPAILAERLETRGDVFLRQASVDGPILMPGGRLGGGLIADGATLRRAGSTALDLSNVDLRGDCSLKGAAVTGRIDLGGARLSADLVALGAAIAAPEAVALDAEGASVRGDLLLRHARVEGEARFDRARCEGALDMTGAALSAPGEAAVSLVGASIKGALILREGARIDGLLDLRGATVGAMVDDPACWPGAGDLALDRCLYGGFLAAPADAATRLRWLALQTPGRWRQDFWPQPYRHLSAVLDGMGHNEDADRVLFENERLQRRARRARARGGAERLTLWLRDGFLRVTVGYGRRSLLVLVWLAALWGAGAGALEYAWRAEAMRPNAAVILRGPEWMQCALEQGAILAAPSLADARPGLALAGESQLDCYLRQPEAAAYPAFNPAMFALDALLPAVDTGQRSFWSPDTRTRVGAFAKGVVYLLTISGWVLGLLAVAGVSGLVRSR
jgi:uncharacterized protein YjbI with pentapeptide repeats